MSMMTPTTNARLVEGGSDMMGKAIEEETLFAHRRDVANDVVDGGDGDDDDDNDAGGDEVDAHRRDVVDGALDGLSRRRRKTVLATVALLWSLVLVLGVCTGYLNAESLDKCGECIRSLSTSSTTSFLQNDTLVEGVFRTAV
jgi:hypothetical protein